MKNPIGESSLFVPIAVNTSSPLSVPIAFNTSSPLELHRDGVPPTAQPPESANQVISADVLVSGLFLRRNFSQEVHSSLLTWNRMKHLINYSQGLPNAVVAVKEARVVWENLMDSFVKEQNGDLNNSSVQKMQEKLCPHFLNKMNATEFADSGYKLRIPCGLIQGSSITVIGIPNGLLGDFRIDLTGESLPGEPDPPIIMHYNVRLQGDKITDDPVIVQNTWTVADDWGEEERCPSPIPGDSKKGTYIHYALCPQNFDI